MTFKLQGQITVDAPVNDVWDLLFDPAAMKQMANKIPGVAVEQFEQTSQTVYAGAATIGVAMIKGKYAGTVTVLDKRTPEYTRLRAEGKGNDNSMGGELSLTLAPQDGKTLLTYLGTGNVSGPIASLGQRLIDTVGKQFVANAAKALGDELAARSRASMAEKPGL